MRPTVIPDIEMWPNSKRITMMPPDGDMTSSDIRAVEMLVDLNKDNIVCYHAMCILEDDDLELLKNGGRVWVSFYGLVPPFCLTVTPQMVEGVDNPSLEEMVSRAKTKED